MSEIEFYGLHCADSPQYEIRGWKRLDDKGAVAICRCRVRYVDATNPYTRRWLTRWVLRSQKLLEKADISHVKT